MLLVLVVLAFSDDVFGEGEGWKSYAEVVLHTVLELVQEAFLTEFRRLETDFVLE